MDVRQDLISRKKAVSDASIKAIIKSFKFILLLDSGVVNELESYRNLLLVLELQENSDSSTEQS